MHTYTHIFMHTYTYFDCMLSKEVLGGLYGTN